MLNFIFMLRIFISNRPVGGM